MTSVKKQRLLNIAFSCLSEGECYLELGTYLGKSVISAMLGNPVRAVYACDDFSQFEGSYEKMRRNLRAYGLLDKVTFYNTDFLKVLRDKLITLPIGLYFYDAAHDMESQYLAIKDAEPLLAREALVIIDDWCWDPTKMGTKKAVKESVNEWRLLYELPARFNGDRAMWWNGVAVYGFKARI